MAVSTEDVRVVLQRLATIWGRIGRNHELRQEMGRAVMRYAERLEVADLNAGVEDLIATAKLQAYDGGPATPPGPSELVGCVLKARDRRQRRAITPRQPNGGMTFHEWWAGLPEGEKTRHGALARLMGKQQEALLEQVQETDGDIDWGP